MTIGFGDILASATPIADGITVPVPADWHQGRTAFGGFTSALALHAALQAGGDLPPLRSAQISMIAPLYGEIEARARVLRRGNNATWISAELSRAGSGGEAGLSGSFVFMKPTESPVHLDAPPPPAWLLPLGDAPPLVSDRRPLFLGAHFDVRVAVQPEGRDPPEQCWWLRAHQRCGLDPVVELLLCADALPTGVTARVKPGAPMSSMQWQVNMLDAAPTSPDGWWLIRAVAESAWSGSSCERMMMWNSKGEPVIAATQSVALFG